MLYIRTDDNTAYAHFKNSSVEQVRIYGGGPKRAIVPVIYKTSRRVKTFVQKSYSLRMVLTKRVYHGRGGFAHKNVSEKFRKDVVSISIRIREVIA